MDFINKFLDMLRSTYIGFLFDDIMWALWVILGIILCLSEFIVWLRVLQPNDYF